MMTRRPHYFLPHLARIDGRRRYLPSLAVAPDAAGLTERGKMDRSADERKAGSSLGVNQSFSAFPLLSSP